MWNKKIFLILCILYVGGSLAKTFQPTSYDYDYLGESRNAPRRHKTKSGITSPKPVIRQHNHESHGSARRHHKGKSVTTTPRPLLQQYWHNFVSNLPTLPPLSWNLTNPIGNLFNAGAQQILETPVANHYTTDDEIIDPPVRRRRPKPSKRKSSKKGKKSRKGNQSRNYYSSYDYGAYDSYEQTAQLNLQPLGLDSNSVMHFFEPATGRYYAMQQETQPDYYGYQNQYNDDFTSNEYDNQYNSYGTGNSFDNGGGSSYEEDDSYYNHNGGYGGQQYQPSGYDADDGYDSGNGYEMGHYDDSGNSGYNSGSGQYEEYDDGVEVADNWGYNDDEIFADRKIKGDVSGFEALAGSIIKIQKHLLKPETAEDVKVLFSLNKKGGNDKKDKDKKDEKKDSEEMEKEDIKEKKDVESVRNVLGTFMKDDAVNRRKQTANTKIIGRLVEQPRGKGKYYILPINFLNKILK